jgi:xylitol oxidase
MNKNWSQTITYRALSVERPDSVREIQDLMENQTITSVKAFGTRHCFNTIADTREDGIHICLDAFKMIRCDNDRDEVHFGAGVTYSELIEEVDRTGKAVENLPSLPHINVVGSMITCTHGSGANHKILAANVTGFEIVLPDGVIRSIVKEDPSSGPGHSAGEKLSRSSFYSHLISFGAIGVITSMSMKVVPPFKVYKSIHEKLQWDTIFNDANFDAIMRAGDFMSFFCDWQKREMSTVWIGRKFPDDGDPPFVGDTFYGAPHITIQRVHPVPGNDPSACVTVGAGSWKNKVYHFLPDQAPSAGGDEIQTEYFVSYRDFRDAMNALYAIREKFNHLVQITELRMIAADDIPMSPGKGTDVVAIHWTWFRRPEEIAAVLPQIEDVLEPFNAKPHFGKLFGLDAATMAKLYGDDLETLKGLIERYDPSGKFRNQFVQHYLFGSSP